MKNPHLFLKPNNSKWQVFNMPADWSYCPDEATCDICQNRRSAYKELVQIAMDNDAIEVPDQKLAFAIAAYERGKSSHPIPILEIDLINKTFKLSDDQFNELLH